MHEAKRDDAEIGSDHYADWEALELWETLVWQWWDVPASYKPMPQPIIEDDQDESDCF